MSDTMTQGAESTPVKKTLTTRPAGLTQPSRRLDALADSYFSIEERTFSAWIDYLRGAAGHLRFFDGETAKINGNWSEALPDKQQAIALEALLNGNLVSEETKALASQPDISVMLAFFSLMQHPQGQFDCFTADHKQHYYRDVLGFEEKAAQPDTVHLVVTLDEALTGITLPAGTRFGGASDVNDVPLIYEMPSNAVLNHAAVASLQMLSGKQAVTFTAHSDSETGAETEAVIQRRILTRHIDAEAGTELDTALGALTFGDVVAENAVALTDNQSFAQMGFSLASPALYLSGGKRVIRLRVGRGVDTEDTPLQLKTWFDLSVSTAEGMVSLMMPAPDEDVAEPPAWSLAENVQIDETDGVYDLVMTFDALFPAITGLAGDLAPGVSPLPHLLFILKPEKEAEAFVLEKKIFTTLTLDISVQGLGGMIASNDDGLLDTSAPFMPFTYKPKIGSCFTFTHPELLVKPIVTATLNFYWIDRPASLTEHYKAYSYYRYNALSKTNYMASYSDGSFDNHSTENNSTEDNSTEDNSSGEPSDLPEDVMVCSTMDPLGYFDSDCLCLQWPESRITRSRSDSITPPSGTGALFSPSLPIDNIDYHQLAVVFPQTAGGNPVAQNGREYQWRQLPLTEADAEKWPKHYSLTLAGNDFGHGDFSQVSQFIAYFNTINLQKMGPEDFQAIQVPEPYTPQLNALTLDYHSVNVIDAATLQDLASPALQFVHPIGRPRIPGESAVALLPRLPETAYLYLGLSQVKTPGEVRLYFQIDPIDGSNVSDEHIVDWRYLTPDGWKILPGSAVGAWAGNARIIEDSTQQLLNPGIVAIEFPALDDILSGLGDGLLWLQVSIFNLDMSPVRYSIIKGVYTQGVAATLVSEGVDASHYQQPLAAESVSELEEADPAIVSVLQPWPSFGARTKESAEALERRASERLRHKQRALTRWDYEHLVLNSFPEVYLSRCYVPQTQLGDEPVDIELMLVPVNHDTSILQPKLPLYLYQRIESFLYQVCPPGLSLRVRDPSYEEVTFDVALKIYTGYDIDAVVSGINQKLIDSLTPWVGEQSEAANFRKVIYLTELAGMLEQHTAVETVHYIRAKVSGEQGDRSYDDTDNIIEPSGDAAILVPSRNHKVVLVDQDVAIVEGVGKWRVEIDFTVT